LVALQVLVVHALFLNGPTTMHPCPAATGWPAPPSPALCSGPTRWGSWSSGVPHGEPAIARGP